MGAQIRIRWFYGITIGFALRAGLMIDGIQREIAVSAFLFAGKTLFEAELPEKSAAELG